MYLLELDHAKFLVSNLFFQKLSKKNGRLDPPLVKGRGLSFVFPGCLTKLVIKGARIVLFKSAINWQVDVQ